MPAICLYCKLLTCEKQARGKARERDRRDGALGRHAARRAHRRCATSAAAVHGSAWTRPAAAPVVPWQPSRSLQRSQKPWPIAHSRVRARGPGRRPNPPSSSSKLPDTFHRALAQGGEPHLLPRAPPPPPPSLPALALSPPPACRGQVRQELAVQVHRVPQGDCQQSTAPGGAMPLGGQGRGRLFGRGEDALGRTCCTGEHPPIPTSPLRQVGQQKSCKWQHWWVEAGARWCTEGRGAASSAARAGWAWPPCRPTLVLPHAACAAAGPA